MATPAQRSMAASIGANVMHAQGKTNTAPGTAAFLSRFEVQVDPDGKLDPAERAKRAAHARSAHFKRLALKSSRARAAKKAAKSKGLGARVDSGNPRVHDARDT